MERTENAPCGGASCGDTDGYAQFLKAKAVVAPVMGFEPKELNSQLFDWQADVVRWACRRGRAALFEDCGLGKSPQSLEWARQSCNHSKRDALILTPLAVAQQMKREGGKFGIETTVCRTQNDVRPGINITNYEMLEHFNPSHFGAVVLDESSILKSYMGKTKRALIEAFAATPYKLCCTATPAPNDHMEIGNHAEFLGVMRSNEMISRWFINDTMNMGTYRLKGHAEKAFWDWVATWAMAMRKPSDIGYKDDDFVLPPLHIHQVNVEVDETEAAGDALFRAPTMNATTMHKEMRLTCSERARKAATMVNGNDESWIVWCNTNYEADELAKLIPEAIEVRGSDSVNKKEEGLTAFSEGRARVIITKPSLAGFGLNWQHCHNAVFVGLSYSFEQLYQAMRRIYRFGQKEPVHIYIIAAQTEGAIADAVRAKMDSHENMMDGMSNSRQKLRLVDDLQVNVNQGHTPLQIPQWLQAA